MDLAQIYETYRELMLAGDAAWWQSFFVRFYQAFIEGNRWQQYLEGVGITIIATAMALAIGVVLGVLVAVVRTAHDQQRPGRPKNFLLGILNLICKVYVTVIRGTPMMVQILIMGMVIFSSSRNYTMVGALTLGINSGAYVAEIIRGGLCPWISARVRRAAPWASITSTPCGLSWSPRRSRPFSRLWATSSLSCSRIPP